MSGLPEGWEAPALVDLVTFNPKHDPETNRDQVISFVPMPAVNEHSGTISEPKERPLAETWKGFTHFADGDVIFAKITPCMENGKSAIAHDLKNGIACGSTEFHVMRPSEGILADYLWRYLRQKSFRDEAAKHMTGAVGQRRVPKPYLEQLRFPLPPLAEQRRIVAKLDQLSARTRAAKDHLTHVQTLATRAKQATLAAAFRGELTGEHVASPNEVHPSLGPLPQGWQVKRLDEIAEIQTGLALGKKRKDGVDLEEHSYLRVANIQRGWLNLSEIKTVAVTAAEFEKLKLQPGDILMNEGGDRDKLERGWVWGGEVKDCIHQNHVFRVRLFDQDFPPHLVSYFANEFGQKFFFDEGQQTTNLASISKRRLSGLPVSVPPPPKAETLLAKIEAAFARIDRMVAEAAKALALLERLEQQLLAKAFRGELVPQDPNDEPASALLARIREARANAPKPKRARKKKGAS